MWNIEKKIQTTINLKVNLKIKSIKLDKIYVCLYVCVYATKTHTHQQKTVRKRKLTRYFKQKYD